jgi:hypothetical protein
VGPFWVVHTQSPCRHTITTSHDCFHIDITIESMQRKEMRSVLITISFVNISFDQSDECRIVFIVNY